MYEQVSDTKFHEFFQTDESMNESGDGPLSSSLFHLVSLPLRGGGGSRIFCFLFFFFINIILPREVGGNRGYSYRA